MENMTLIQFCNYLTLNGYRKDTVRRFNIDCNMIVITGVSRLPDTLEEWITCFDAWKINRMHVIRVH